LPGRLLLREPFNAAEDDGGTELCRQPGELLLDRWIQLVAGPIDNGDLGLLGLLLFVPGATDLG
jgi:hypothetical protein